MTQFFMGRLNENSTWPMGSLFLIGSWSIAKLKGESLTGILKSPIVNQPILTWTDRRSRYS